MPRRAKQALGREVALAHDTFLRSLSVRGRGADGPDAPAGAARPGPRPRVLMPRRRDEGHSGGLLVLGRIRDGGGDEDERTI